MGEAGDPEEKRGSTFKEEEEDEEEEEEEAWGRETKKGRKVERRMKKKTKVSYLGVIPT